MPCLVYVVFHNSISANQHTVASASVGLSSEIDQGHVVSKWMKWQQSPGDSFATCPCARHRLSGLGTADGVKCQGEGDLGMTRVLG